MIYFSSDFHYGHKNIVKGVSSWANTENCRNFPDIPTHNKTIVDNINKTVGVNDTLYFLGDWNFGGVDNIWKLRKELNVLNIHYCFGNHDKQIIENKILNIPLEDECQLKQLIGDSLAVKNERNLYTQAQDLFSSCQWKKEIKVEGQRIILDHYAHRVWNKSHKGSFMLFGHSHSTLPDIGGLTMDVGIDSAYKILGEYRPFSFQEIKEIMKYRSKEIVDHHNENTN